MLAILADSLDKLALASLVKIHCVKVDLDDLKYKIE